IGKDGNPYQSLVERLGGDEEAAPAADFAALTARRQQAAVGQAVDRLQRLLGTGGMQAYCLDCPPAASGKVSAEPVGWLQILAKALG
ncbi:MAG: signal peptide peptidase SppA, partial [Novosphingobium sp.]